LRTLIATATAAATWAGLVALAGLLVDIPAGAFAFVAVLVVVLVAAGRFLALGGFGTGSFAILIAVGCAGIVAIGVMHTRLLPLLIGVLVILFAFTPSLFVFTIVRGEAAGEQPSRASTPPPVP
jgi:hypothetical protein